MITSNSTDDPLYRIQREISEVVERELELRNGYITPPRLSDDGSSPNTKKLQKAFSTSTLTAAKRFTAFNPEQKGIMEKFYQGKISLTPKAALNEPSSILWTPELTPPKLQVVPGEKVRKGYVPVEEKIQKELREMQKREAELRAHQRKVLAVSQPDLLAILDQPDSTSETPPLNKLHSTRSINNICDSNYYSPDTASAPASLRPAISLAQLCDDLNESDVPSSSMLIAKFESIIQQNRESTVNSNHL